MKPEDKTPENPNAIRILEALLICDSVLFSIDDPRINTGIIPRTGTPNKELAAQVLEYLKTHGNLKGFPNPNTTLLTCSPAKPEGATENHLPVSHIEDADIINTTTGKFRAGKPIFHLQRNPNVPI